MEEPAEDPWGPDTLDLRDGSAEDAVRGRGASARPRVLWVGGSDAHAHPTVPPPQSGADAEAEEGDTTYEQVLAGRDYQARSGALAGISLSKSMSPKRGPASRAFPGSRCPGRARTIGRAPG